MQASEVLAADMRLELAAADRRGLSRRGAASRPQHRTRPPALLSVVFNGDASQLTNVRAVTAGLSAARQGAGGERALRQGHAGRAAFRRRGRSGRTRGCSPRSARAVGRTLLDRRRELSRRSRPDLAPDQGGTFAELAPGAAHERGGSARDAADPARQPRQLRRAVRRRRASASTAFKAVAADAQAAGRAPARHRGRQSADQERRRSRRPLPQPGEPGERAAVRDRGGDVGAPLRAAAPGYRRAAEDTGRDARIHALADVCCNCSRSRCWRQLSAPCSVTRAGMAGARAPRTADGSDAAAAEPDAAWASVSDGGRGAGGLCAAAAAAAVPRAGAARAASRCRPAAAARARWPSVPPSRSSCC